MQTDTHVLQEVQNEGAAKMNSDAGFLKREEKPTGE